MLRKKKKIKQCLDLRWIQTRVYAMLGLYKYLLTIYTKCRNMSSALGGFIIITGPSLTSCLPTSMLPVIAPMQSKYESSTTTSSSAVSRRAVRTWGGDGERWG